MIAPHDCQGNSRANATNKFETKYVVTFLAKTTASTIVLISFATFTPISILDQPS